MSIDNFSERNRISNHYSHCFHHSGYAGLGDYDGGAAEDIKALAVNHLNREEQNKLEELLDKLDYTVYEKIKEFDSQNYRARMASSPK